MGIGEHSVLPEVLAQLRSDRSAIVVFNGGTYELRGEDVTDTRAQALHYITGLAAQIVGGPVQVALTDPDGTGWRLVVTPDGDVIDEAPATGETTMTSVPGGARPEGPAPHHTAPHNTAPTALSADDATEHTLPGMDRPARESGASAPSAPTAQGPQHAEWGDQPLFPDPGLPPAPAPGASSGPTASEAADPSAFAPPNTGVPGDVPGAAPGAIPGGVPGTSQEPAPPHLGSPPAGSQWAGSPSASSSATDSPAAGPLSAGSPSGPQPSSAFAPGSVADAFRGPASEPAPERPTGAGDQGPLSAAEAPAGERRPWHDALGGGPEAPAAEAAPGVDPAQGPGQTPGYAADDHAQGYDPTQGYDSSQAYYDSSQAYQTGAAAHGSPDVPQYAGYSQSPYPEGAAQHAQHPHAQHPHAQPPHPAAPQAGAHQAHGYPPEPGTVPHPAQPGVAPGHYGPAADQYGTVPAPDQYGAAPTQPGVPAAPGQPPAPGQPGMTPAPGQPAAGEQHPRRRDLRESFLRTEQAEAPATQGMRGALGKIGIRTSPSASERAERADVNAVSQHWPGVRTIAVVNGKGGANKTPTTALLAAIFARNSGSATLAWDNNETRGTLGWRTEQGKHEATVQDLLPQGEALLDPSAKAGDISHFVHHQAADKYDVLRSNPNVLSAEQRINGDDVDLVHDVAGRYYRLIFIDSGNDESADHWLQMIDKADQLVVATIAKPEHAEAGALLLEALAQRDERSAQLARGAVVVVSQAREKDANPSAQQIADGFAGWVRDVVTIPYDRAMVESVLRFDSLGADTQRAWLRAGAAVAAGL